LWSYRSINTVSLYVKDVAKLYCKRNYTKKRKEIGEKEAKKTQKVLGQ
jgi:hypothetical protein